MKVFLSVFLPFIVTFGLAAGAESVERAVPPLQQDSMPTLLSIVSANASRPTAAALGEIVVLRVASLQTLLDRSVKERSPLALIINGMPLKGAFPCAIMPEKGEISFPLARSGPARMVWDGFLQTRGREHFFTQDVAVTTGLDNGSMSAGIADDVPNFSFVLVRRPIFYSCAALALFLFVLFHVVAYKSDLVRDAGIDPAGGRKPYSLSRTQMALWFFIVVTSFLMLWVETGRIDTMPLSVIVLLGISAATALGAAVIDAARKQGAAAERSRDFLIDILSDEHGVCFHRFQMAGWTVVLAFVFLYTVFTEMRMPEFDTSLLALMGISAGTYLGYKLPERSRSPLVVP